MQFYQSYDYLIFKSENNFINNVIIFPLYIKTNK